MKSDTPKSGLLTFGIVFAGFATLGLMVVDILIRPPVGWLNLMPIYCLAVFALLHSLHFLGAKRALWFLVLGLLLPYVAEYLGTNFGAIFGSHWFHHTKDLQTNVGLTLPGGVPLNVVFTWFGMLYVAFLASVYLVRAKASSPSSFAAVPLTAGLVVMLWQLSAGPVAMARNAVDFSQNGFFHGIPAASFFGWYVTAMFVILFFLAIEPGAADAENLVRSDFSSRTALLMLSLVLAYPAVMCFRFGMWGAGLLGVAVILLAALAIGIRNRTLTAAPRMTRAPAPTT